MTNTALNDNLIMPPNTNSLSTNTNNNLSQSNNNCGSNQQAETLFSHHLHSPLHSTNSRITSQALYQTSIALPTLNASSDFYTPHFTMHPSQFSPISSSTPIVAVPSSLTASSINGINQPDSTLYSVVHQSISHNGSFGKNGDDNPAVAFMEPQQSTILGNNERIEDTGINSSGSSGSASLAGSNCSAVSSYSSENGGTSSTGSISSLTSASQYKFYHANSSYSKYRQTQVKPESNGNYNEKYWNTFSDADIALATKPGSIGFDPSSCHFSDEDLRPQPMNKKSRKQNVPDSLKDDKYWARRAKNNVAAKKSREQRRLKENQVLLRASYLEKQNQALRVELQLLRHEHAKYLNNV